jgi:RimJ/RimL family protein N-acetyltransferase
VSARLGEGHRIFVLRVDDRPVSFAWVTESMTFSIDELEACVTTDRPVIWIWDCVTPDAFRGRGYYTRLLRAPIARFDVERITIYCQPKNYASIRGIQKAGFAPWMSVAATRWRIRIQRDGDFPGTFRVMRRVP